MNHLTLKANGQLVTPLEKYVCKSHKKMFYLLTCVHINSSRTHETLRITILPQLLQRSQSILQQRCCLQPITHEKKKKRKNEKEQHIVFVYFDIEAQKDTGNHIANLVCAENDTQFTFQGKDCIQQYDFVVPMRKPRM